MLEECGDPLPRDPEQPGDALDGQAGGPEGVCLGGPELRTGSLQHRQVGGQQLCHAWGVFGFDQGDQIVAGFEMLLEPTCPFLEQPASLDIAGGSFFEFAQRSEESLEFGH